MDLAAPEWNLKTWALCLGIAVVLPLWTGGRAAGDNSSRLNENSSPFCLVSRSADQSEPNISNCPLLPGCPGGPSVPLPPKLKPVPKPSAPTPSVDANNLVEGVGKYKRYGSHPCRPF